MQDRNGCGLPDGTNFFQSVTTTLMLRNIPNKYTQLTLQQEIDDNGFQSTYDFLYLPFHQGSKSNAGYAFINFRFPATAHRFRAAFSTYSFRRFKTKKTGNVCDARIQGLQSNKLHFAKRKSRNERNCPIVLEGTDGIHYQDVFVCAEADADATKKEHDVRHVQRFSEKEEKEEDEEEEEEEEKKKKKKEEDEVEETLGPNATQARLKLEASICKLLGAFRKVCPERDALAMRANQTFPHPTISFAPRAGDSACERSTAAMH